MGDDWTPNLLKEHYDERIQTVSDRLDGFRQEYAARKDVERVRDDLAAIRVDHVQRREFDDIKARLNESSGRRTAFVAATSVVVSILAIMFGVILRGGITHADVSQQIQNEAPWVADRPAIDQRIRALEQENVQLRLRLAQIDSLNRFFCRTRQPTLPAC